jgi:uncharacterized protein (DUF697 family)
MITLRTRVSRAVTMIPLGTPILCFNKKFCKAIASDQRASYFSGPSTASVRITMNYEDHMRVELESWKIRMERPASFFNGLSKRMQDRMNSVIPERIHAAITAAIKQMTRAVIFGAGIANVSPPAGLNLEVREVMARDRIRFYRNTAAAEGAVTGAGGFLLGLADFPLWLSIKMKMLFEIGTLYGADMSDYKERVYLLHIFQLTFSSQKNRNKVFRFIANWSEERAKLPDDINQFEWRTFQQEYRDYIDLAKLLQLIPGIGAVVGAVVNHRLTGKLGDTAMNAYRMRWPDIASATHDSNPPATT